MSCVLKALLFVSILVASNLFANGLPLPSAMAVMCDSCALLDRLPPLEQAKNHRLINQIVCQGGFLLLTKLSNGDPACVKPLTAQKLVERGWGMLNEKTVWFEYTGIECQQTPWDKFGSTFALAFTKDGLIKQYFKDQGITIIEPMWTYYRTQSVPVCGSPAVFSYYFLVPQSDVDKMTNLGYKKIDTVPSNVHLVE